MQKADIIVSLSGDVRTQVPVEGASVARVLALQAIHGEGSVSGIKITGEHELTDRQEYNALLGFFGKYQDRITSLWRDNGARWPQTFEELNLQPAAFARDQEIPQPATFARGARTKPAPAKVVEAEM